MFTALFRRSRGKLLAGHSPGLHAFSMLRKEESLLQVDLRVHGVSRDDIYKDGEQIIEMQNLVGDGCRDKSIIEDLKQKRRIQCAQRGIKAQVGRYGQY